MVLGGAVHAALAEHHRQLQAREERDAALVPERVLAEVEAEWQRREGEGTVAYPPDESRDELLGVARRLVTAYLATEPPTGIVAVEERVTVPLVNSRGAFLEKPLVAVADLVYGEPGELTVRELKTSARAFSQGEVDLAPQATCYAHATHQRHGVWPRVEYCVLTKTKTPRAQLVTTERTASHAGRLGDLVESVDRAVTAGVFYPIESPLNCSGCPFRSECRAWRPSGSPTAPRPELHQVLHEAAHQNGVARC
jgi:CRISPR/Cas system-associated exonuclease Cas4 (RecB family)